MIAPIDFDVPSQDCLRLRSIKRVLTLIGLLSPLRLGATYAELQRDMADAGYPVSQRTIHRDLQVLHSLGLVEHIGPNRWQWCGIGHRAAVIAMASQERAADF